MSSRRRRSLRNTLNDDADAGRVNVRRAFQAKVQKLLAVRWFTEKPGIKTSHITRKGYCPLAGPCHEEQAVLGGVLTSPFLMQKTTELLQHFQHELSGIHGFFDELGVLPKKVAESRFGGDVEPMSAERKKDILMRLAVKAVHQSKWTALRICWHHYIQKQDQELKWLRHHYDELQQQFATIRQDYLQEVSMLRDQTRVRGDMDSSDWTIQGRGSDVVYFFDPAKALTPKETEFMLLAVKEKLTMILESNPRVAGCVDLGQFEKLKELKENQEIQEMRQALVRKGHEIAELRQTVTQQQEELTTPKTSKPALEMQVMADLEEKVADLRSSATQLKQEMREESKERRLAESSLETARLECSELQACVDDLEKEQALLQSALGDSKRELEDAQERIQELLSNERDLQARLASLSETCEGLKKAVRRARIAESRKPEPTSPVSIKSLAVSVKSVPFLEEPMTPELVPEPAPVDSRENRSSELSLLDEAHEQLLEAWATRDAEMAKVEELNRQNDQLRRQLAKQSQGLLLLDADNAAGEAQQYSSFVQTVRTQLLKEEPEGPKGGQGAADFHMSFPELEAELKDVSAEAEETSAAVRSALEQVQVGSAAPGDLENLQQLQQRSLACQCHKRDLERKLLELSMDRLGSALAPSAESKDPQSAKVGSRQLQGVTLATMDLLTEAGNKMQGLAAENTELRGALLSLSTRLAQATSLMQASPALPGDGALQKCLTTITRINEDHVPAVFNRLFNDPRRSSIRHERQARERKAELMKSSCIHLSEESPHRPSLHSAVDVLNPARPVTQWEVSGAEDLPISPTEEASRTRGVRKMLRRNSSQENDKEGSGASDGRGLSARPFPDSPEGPSGFIRPREFAASDDVSDSAHERRGNSRLKQRRESFRMSSFELRPDLDKTLDKDSFFPMCAMNSEPRVSYHTRLSADSPEGVTDYFATSSRHRIVFGKQRSLADREGAESSERRWAPKLKQRQQHQHRVLGLDVKGDVDRAFDKAIEKMSPRQPRIPPSLEKDEGFVLPLMSKVAYASPRGPISPSSGDEAVAEPPRAQSSSSLSSSEGSAMLHAATCPAEEPDTARWHSEHLPAVPMISIQQLELRQDSRTSANEPTSSRRQMSKADALYHPRAPKESWRSSVQNALSRRRNSDISSTVNRPDPPQMRRRSFLGL